MRNLCISGILVLQVLFASAQHITDSLLLLPEVSITAERLVHYAAGQKVTSVDSVVLENDRMTGLGEMLQKHSGVFIKSYNSGGLSSIAFRGTSASHAGVYWNDIPLNTLNSGILDLSLIRTGMFEKVDVLHGGASSLFGSGNIGGSIHLSNEPLFGNKKSLNLNLSLGSFESIGGYASLLYSTEDNYFKTSFQGYNAKNNFKYETLNGKNIKLENNAVKHYDFVQDYSKKFNSGILEASLWLHKTRREIPPTLLSLSSNAKQTDESFRTLLKYRHFHDKFTFRWQTSYTYDFFWYFDNDETINTIDSKIATHRPRTEGRVRFKTGGLDLNGGLFYTYSMGESANWQGTVNRNEAGAFLLSSYFIPGIEWKSSLNLRQEFIEGYNVPFTPSFGLEGKIFHWLEGKVNASKNFRAPTFNDRFWVPGGNPDLLPEESFNQEASLMICLQKSKTSHVSLEGTYFNSDVKNWILWVPIENYSKPENIQNVWSRGAEAIADARIKTNTLRLFIRSGYTYARSTIQNKRWPNDLAYKKQLIYVPVHKIHFYGQLTNSNYGFSYNHTFASKIYTTSDNLESLPGFHLAGVNLWRNINSNSTQFKIQLKVDNIWDADYQVIPYYPNPGRSFNFSIFATLNYNEKTE